MNWVLQLNEGTKFAAVVLQIIVTFARFLDSCMTSTHRDVVSDTHITFLTSTYLDLRLIFSVDDIENFLGYGCRVNRFKDYKIIGGLFNVNYINQTIVVSYLEGKDLFAEFTIHLFELNDDLSSVNFNSSLGFEPTLETFQMNRIYSTNTVAR